MASPNIVVKKAIHVVLIRFAVASGLLVFFFNRRKLSKKKKRRKRRLRFQFKFMRLIHSANSKTLFTWSGGPRSSGVGFFCFVSLRA